MRLLFLVAIMTLIPKYSFSIAPYIPVRVKSSKPPEQAPKISPSHPAEGFVICGTQPEDYYATGDGCKISIETKKDCIFCGPNKTKLLSFREYLAHRKGPKVEYLGISPYMTNNGDLRVIVFYR